MKAAKVVLLASAGVYIGGQVAMGLWAPAHGGAPGPAFIVAIIALCLSVITAGISAAVYAGGLRRNKAAWGIASFLLPFLTPFILVFLRPRDARTGSGGGLVWQCPSCGFRLQKTTEGRERWQTVAATGIAIVGTVTCGSCGQTVSARDVYAGRYDV
jgi:hypothetical protein